MQLPLTDADTLFEELLQDLPAQIAGATHAPRSTSDRSQEIGVTTALPIFCAGHDHLSNMALSRFPPQPYPQILGIRQLSPQPPKAAQLNATYDG